MTTKTTSSSVSIDLEAVREEFFRFCRNATSGPDGTISWPLNSIRNSLKRKSSDVFDQTHFQNNKFNDNLSRRKFKLPLPPKNESIDADSYNGPQGFDYYASNYLLTQIRETFQCTFYKPVFLEAPLKNEETALVENELSCARSEPFVWSYKYDMLGWLTSMHRKSPKFVLLSDPDIINGSRRVTSPNLPLAKRLQNLRKAAVETVGVFRSDIHGRGLFCIRGINAGEMIIEYAGEVIRSSLTDKREKYYTSKGIGCYMFRIDDRFVVDATMCGNAARFINHSCEPNCYARIVDNFGKNHIIIEALRRISEGEELTYDYRFPLENEKIVCHCRARKCRKYLN